MSAVAIFFGVAPLLSTLVHALGAPAAADSSPQQLHIAFGTEDDSMVVCWATMGDVHAGDQVVRWGLQSADPATWTHVAAAITIDGDSGFFKHRAILRGLHPNTTYGYVVGGADQTRRHHRSSHLHAALLINGGGALPYRGPRLDK